MKVNSVQEAKKIILDSIKPINKSEIVSLDACMDRILVGNLRSKRTQPAFNTSSMDGYAVISKDIKKSLTKLKLIGEIKAGDIPKLSLKPGSAFRVFTGSFLPKGSDRVIIKKKVISL